MSHVQQIHAALGVCEGAYTQAVGGMQLFHQEAAADLDDLRELEQASRRQQALNGLLFQLKDTYNARTIKRKKNQKPRRAGQGQGWAKTAAQSRFKSAWGVNRQRKMLIK